MTVKELIDFLKTCNQDLRVVYMRCSERALLEEKDIQAIEACLPRPDGWVPNKRPDKPSEIYLEFPGL